MGPPTTAIYAPQQNMGVPAMGIFIPQQNMGPPIMGNCEYRFPNGDFY